MQTAIFPSARVGRPFPSSLRQVSPPSMVTWMPLPGPPLSLLQVFSSRSQVVATIFRGLCGSMTIS